LIKSKFFGSIKILESAEEGREMKENKFRSALAGVVLGIIFGTIYFGWPAKCLITGTMPVDGLFLPEGVQSEIILISLKWGCIIGTVIGFLAGLSVSIRMPRGHLAKTISCTTFLICTPLAFMLYGSQLWLMSAGRIAITIFYMFCLFIIAVPFGSALGFIEKVRE